MMHLHVHLQMNGMPLQRKEEWKELHGASGLKASKILIQEKLGFP